MRMSSVFPDRSGRWGRSTRRSRDCTAPSDRPGFRREESPCAAKSMRYRLSTATAVAATLPR